MGQAARQTPSSGPWPDAVYNELSDLGGPTTVNNMTPNAGYAVTKL